MDYLKLTGFALVVLSSAIIFFLLLRKNESFFNVRNVVKKHFSLFENCRSQYVVFYIMPLFFSIGLALIYCADITFYSNMSVILGILISMLFAILSILSSVDFSGYNKSQKDKANVVVLETVNAIVFDSILCLALMLYSLVVTVISGIDFTAFSINETVWGIIKMFVSGVAYYLFTVILLTLMLIVKRMSKIIDFKLKAKKEDDQ